MNYEIECKMIEIQNLSKILKRELTKDDVFEVDFVQAEDRTDE